MLALITAGVIVYVSPLREEINVRNARAFASYLSTLWYGPLVFVLTYAVAAVLLVPASVFVLSAGVIWGWKFGAAYAVIGGFAGAILSFWLAQWIGDGILQKFGRPGQQLAKGLQRARFKSILILRLVPLFPFAVVNYGAGVAGVKFSDYALATAIGMVPSAIVFTYSADALVNGKMTGSDAALRLFGVGVALAALVLLPALFKRRAAKVLEVEAEPQTLAEP